jgi:hypothetical protein
MNDDKHTGPQTHQPPLRTPNREYRRTPPVIEGEASSSRTDAPASARNERETDGVEARPIALGGPTDQAAPAATVDEKKSPTETAGETPAADAAPISDALKEKSDPDAKSASADEPPPLETSAAASTVAAETPPSPPPLAPPPPEKGQRGYGLGALAGASLGSAALAALAVFGLQTASAPSGPSTAALESRIADVEKRASAPAPQVAPAALAALEKRVASVEAVASGAADTARKAAEAAARPAAAPQGVGSSQQALAALGDRLVALEKGAESAAARLNERIGALEKALAAPKAEDRVTETRIEPAPAPVLDLDPLRKQMAEQVGALASRLQALEKQAAPLAEAARAAEARIKGVEERIQPLAGQVADARAQGEAERKRTAALAEQSADAARVALAQSLGAAIGSGAPFSAQVEALVRLGVPADRLAPLREAAKTGVATNAQLARELAALEPKIVTRPETSGDASIVDRLANSALGLVRVRPTGDATGAAPADVFARVSRAVQGGDIAAAMKEWETLPDSAKSASVDWAKRARDRLVAEGAARALTSAQNSGQSSGQGAGSAQTPGRS